MGDIEAAGSPTVRRWQLGQELRRLREAAGQTGVQAAHQLGKSDRTLTRWEAGRVGIPEADLEKLLTQYRVPPGKQAELLTLNREGALSGWWVDYRDVIRPSYARFIGLAAEAIGLEEWCAMLIPGLLQTDDYAEAILRYHEPKMTEDVIAKRLEVRRRRKEEAEAQTYPIHYIFDESVIRRVIGDAQTMAEQMDHLLAMAQQPRITIEVLPFDTQTSFRPISGGFAILRFAEMNPVAVAEMLAGDIYADGAEAVPYTRQFEALRREALDEPTSLEMIGSMRGSFAL